MKIGRGGNLPTIGVMECWSIGKVFVAQHETRKAKRRFEDEDEHDDEDHGIARRRFRHSHLHPYATAHFPTVSHVRLVTFLPRVFSINFMKTGPRGPATYAVK